MTTMTTITITTVTVTPSPITGPTAHMVSLHRALTWRQLPLQHQQRRQRPRRRQQPLQPQQRAPKGQLPLRRQQRRALMIYRGFARTQVHAKKKNVAAKSSKELGSLLLMKKRRIHTLFTTSEGKIMVHA